MKMLTTLVVSALFVGSTGGIALAADVDPHSGYNARFLDYPAGGVTFYHQPHPEHPLPTRGEGKGVGAFGAEVADDIGDKIHYSESLGGHRILGGPPYGPAD